MPDASQDLAVNDCEIFLLKIQKAERGIFKFFDEKKKDKEWIIEYCTLGPSDACPALVASLVQLEDLFAGLLDKYPEEALRCGFVTKYCSIRRKLLEMFHIVLKNSSTVIERVKPQVLML